MDTRAERGDRATGRVLGGGGGGGEGSLWKRRTNGWWTSAEAADRLEEEEERLRIIIRPAEWRDRTGTGPGNNLIPMSSGGGGGNGLDALHCPEPVVLSLADSVCR